MCKYYREWVQENTGKTSVPQIYFNSQYIGGNKELQQQWQHQTKKQTLLAILQNKYDEGRVIDGTFLPKNEVEIFCPVFLLRNLDDFL